LIVEDYATKFDQYLAYSILSDHANESSSASAQLVRNSFGKHLYDSVIKGLLSLSTQQFPSEALHHVDELMQQILTEIRDSIKT